MRGELFFSGKCNYDCFFCLRNEIGKKETTSNYDRLDEWIEVLEYNRVKEVTLSSFNCEPTIQPEFIPIVNKLYEKGFKLELRTNGSFKSSNQMTKALSKFNYIWFSIQSLNKDTLRKIAGTSKIPDFKKIFDLLPHVQKRVSILINKYNSQEVIPILNKINELDVKIVQLRKFYVENSNEITEDVKAFDKIKNIIEKYPIEEESKFKAHKVLDMSVSLWEDILVEEKGIKYFPSTEIITDCGRIIPILKKEDNNEKI